MDMTKIKIFLLTSLALLLGESSYLYRFQIDNGQLTLKDPYLYDRENGDRPLSVYDSHLETYGIKSLTPILKIESVRKGKLILSDSNVRLCFDKF